MESVERRRATAERLLELYRKGEQPRGLETLDIRSREVLIRHIYERESLASIGNYLGLSRERVRQIEAQALSKLASWLS